MVTSESVDGNTRELKSEQFSALNIREVEASQSKNANAPIDLTELGIAIEVIDLQPSNASRPIDVTEFGIVIEVRATQL